MRRLVFGSILLCVTLIGCEADPYPIGAALQAASSGLVASYTTREGNFLDPPRIYLKLVPAAKSSEVHALWCDVVIPTLDREHVNVEMVIQDASGAQLDTGDC